MSRRSLLDLRKILRPHIEGESMRMRSPVNVVKKVACTLHYLIDEGPLRKTAKAFCLSCQVVSKIMWEVYRASQYTWVWITSSFLLLKKKKKRKKGKELFLILVVLALEH